MSLGLSSRIGRLAVPISLATAAMTAALAAVAVSQVRHDVPTFGLAGAIALLCAVVGALAFLLHRELRMRLAAEAALKALADTDGLTGLASRRRFDEVLPTEWRRAARGGTSLCLLLIEVDRFAAFSARPDRRTGDEMVQALAATLRAGLRRPGDLCARFGDAAFAVLLPDTGLAGGWATAERLRLAVTTLRVPPAGESGPTVSIGVSSLNPNARMRERELVDAAAAALDQAKRNGSNRTELAVSHPLRPPGLTDRSSAREA
jgi:diguanylate cyclase (GGDEF)-like protein